MLIEKRSEVTKKLPGPAAASLSVQQPAAAAAVAACLQPVIPQRSNQEKLAIFCHVALSASVFRTLCTSKR